MDNDEQLSALAQFSQSCYPLRCSSPTSANSLRARAGSKRKQPTSSFTAKRGSHMSTYTAATVPTQFVEANGIRFAYRRWGKRSGLPLVFNQHFTGNLDNWDPAVLDGLAKEREVIIFTNAGVASSTGEVPTTFEGMAKKAEAFIGGLGLTKLDLLGFSIGGMVGQEITLDRPGPTRRL